MSKRDSAFWVMLNTGSAWAAQMTGMLVGFCMTPFLLSHLGDRQYGLLSLASSMALWCGFAASPIGTYASRYATEHFERGETEEMNRSLGTSLVFALVAAGGVGACVLICALYAGPLLGVPQDILVSARVAIVIVGMGTALTVVIRVLEAGVFISRKFYLRHLSEIGSRIVGAVIIVAYFMIVGSSVGVWLFAGVWLPLLAVLFVVCPLSVRGLPARYRASDFSWPEVRRAVPFVGMLAIMGIGGPLFDGTDALVISHMPQLGLEQVAAYDIGARWMRLIKPLIDAFCLSISPAMVAIVARGSLPELGDAIAGHSRRALLLGIVPVCGLALVACSFIRHWVGPEYLSRSVPVMWIMLGTAFLYIPGILAFRALVALSQLRLLMIGNLLAGVLNLALSVAFVGWLGWGLCGVAAGTLVATFVWATIGMPLLACHYCGTRWWGYCRETWLRPAATGAVAFGVGWLLVLAWTPRSLAETLCQMCVVCALVVALAWMIGLKSAERERTRLRIGPVLARVLMLRKERRS